MARPDHKLETRVCEVGESVMALSSVALYNVLVSRLLVVEDYPPLATVLGVALRRAGHETVRHDRVAKALETEETFVGAVLDIDLADGSGVDLAEQLLDQGRVGWVVFFTANRTREIVERAQSFGTLVDKASGLAPLMSEVELATRGVAKAVGAEDATVVHAPGRSGTRRRVRQ